MVAAIATRHSELCFGIEAEVCPKWAQPLIGIQPPQGVLGVPYECVSLVTREVQAALFPIPVSSQRKRTRDMTVGSKSYTKSWPVAFYDACLSLALGKQPDLFAELTWQDGPEDIAILCFSRLYDFAKKLGMSYDQAEQWMMLLIILGFIRRFRHGRRFLYVIPLAEYSPQPSPEIVRNKLKAFILKQFSEQVNSDGSTGYRDRNPEFTEYLMQICARFEKYYGLTPTEPQLIPPCTETDLEQLLSEIHQALPTLSREELLRLTPILMKRLIEDRQVTKPQTKRRATRVLKTGDFVNSSLSTKIVPTHSAINEDTQGGEFSAREEGFRGTKVVGNEVIKGQIESTLSEQKRQSGTIQVHSRFSGPSQDDGKEPSRFLPKGSAFSTGETQQTDKVDSVADSSLTLRSISSLKNKENYVNVSTATLDQQQLIDKEKRCLELGEELARILLDEKSKQDLSNIHRRGNPRLIKAALIMTMYTGLNSEYRKSAGACFQYYFDEWSKKYKSYNEACQAWKNWGGKESKGIPTKIQKWCDAYQDYTYLQIAEAMGFEMDPITLHPFLVGSQRTDAFLEAVRSKPSLSRADAEVLEAEIRCHASWYFPSVCIFPLSKSHVEDSYIVEAEGDYRYTFTDREQWLDIHKEMVSLPAECEQWYQSAHEKRQNSDEMEDACVQSALAFLTYCYQGLHNRDEQVANWDRITWERLVAIGKPIRFPREDIQFDGITQETETFQFLASVQTIELENGIILNTDLARELLLAGEIVELDADTIVTFGYYQACYQRDQQMLVEEHQGIPSEGMLSSMMDFEINSDSPFIVAPESEQERNVVCTDGEVGPTGEDIQDISLIVDGDVLTFREAAEGYKMLTSTLNMNFYQIALKTQKTRAGGCGFVVEVESGVSGTVWRYGSVGEIAGVVAGVEDWGEEEEE